MILYSFLKRLKKGNFFNYCNIIYINRFLIKNYLSIHDIVIDKSEVKIMSEYYCHECSIKMGLLTNEIEKIKPSGTGYQLEKYYKHTVPPECSGTISIFEKDENKKYKEYFINSMASGCVEIDGHGRKNIVWVAGEKQGLMFKDGSLMNDVDCVKVVLPDDPKKIHAFPTGSNSLSTEICTKCGKSIVY